MMAAEGNNNIIRGIYTGNEIPERRVIEIEPSWGEEIMEFLLPDITHLEMHPYITVIPDYLFRLHPNIIELICHENIVKIEKWAFFKCPRLKRLIMNGVIEVEDGAVNDCRSLEYVECNKLERIGIRVFGSCFSLRDINLPSARIVEEDAFNLCEAMKEVKFGKRLESIGDGAFGGCLSLVRIWIPLKNNLFPYDNTFQDCENLRAVHLVEEKVLNDTVNALLLEDWKNDMRRVIDSINHNMSNAYAGDAYYDIVGRKTIVLREWISSVLSEIIHYKAQHRLILNEAASTLEHLLPKDMVMNNVLPFVELPSYTFDGEEDDDGFEG